MNNFDSARTFYKKTLDLSPRGFYTAISALDTLTREHNGELPTGTFLMYVSLEWINDPGKKAEAARKLSDSVPDFAPAWLEVANCCEKATERIAAIEKGLSVVTDADTKGLLLINKAMFLEGNGEHDTACKMLKELAFDSSSTFSTEHMAKAMLEKITPKGEV
jgi:hypothetical protein